MRLLLKFDFGTKTDCYCLAARAAAIALASWLLVVVPAVSVTVQAGFLYLCSVRFSFLQAGFLLVEP
ncbi:hypothetical protein SESBI_43711 [Sesbania bispinosa]|nr:hypothetical protein SESBI_43711 [Sesbania bispinosa]